MSSYCSSLSPFIKRGDYISLSILTELSGATEDRLMIKMRNRRSLLLLNFSTLPSFVDFYSITSHFLLHIYSSRHVIQVFTSNCSPCLIYFISPTLVLISTSLLALHPILPHLSINILLTSFTCIFIPLKSFLCIYFQNNAHLQ